MQPHCGTGDAETIVLPPILDHHAVAALLPGLCRAAAAGAARLDGAAVERVGQAGLQLILAATRSGGVTMTAGSAALRRAVELAGLDMLVALPDGEAAA